MQDAAPTQGAALAFLRAGLLGYQASCRVMTARSSLAGRGCGPKTINAGLLENRINATLVVG
jgi:hypothetical protein